MAAKQIADNDLRIALLDDRQEPRETVIFGLRPKLPKGWTCIECPLLKNPQGYPAWLINNHVSVLLLDQMLNEQAPDSDLPVTYKGNDVILAIRQQIPDFPIVVVTKAREDTDLQNHFGEADDIVDRTALLGMTDQYVVRIVRLGRAYLSQFEAELTRLAELSKKKAMGKETQVDAKALEAMQAKLGLPSMAAADGDDALNSLENKVEKLEKLSQKVNAFLEHNPGTQQAARKATKKKAR